MNDMERRLIERIRESDEAKQIVEGFLFRNQKSPTDLQEPSVARETSP
jgi:hypothetical protein